MNDVVGADEVAVVVSEDRLRKNCVQLRLSVKIQHILIRVNVARLDSLEAEVFGRIALHPRLNVQMRLVDMLFFQAEHDDYHLTRISELLRTSSFQAKGNKSVSGS